MVRCCGGPWTIISRRSCRDRDGVSAPRCRRAKFRPSLRQIHTKIQRHHYLLPLGEGARRVDQGDRPSCFAQVYFTRPPIPSSGAETRHLLPKGEGRSVPSVDGGGDVERPLNRPSFSFPTGRRAPSPSPFGTRACLVEIFARPYDKGATLLRRPLVTPAWKFRRFGYLARPSAFSVACTAGRWATRPM